MAAGENDWKENFMNNNSVIIKVDTNVMIAKANEVEEKTKEMKKQLAEVEQMIRESGNHWLGEAGEQHRNQFYTRKADVDRLINNLAQHPVHLREAANIYSGLASENDQIQQALPTDVIS